MSISIQFYGAARQVTGSRHLVELGDRRILLDCGMVQGPRKISNKLNNHLQFDPEQLDAVVLSHGHIDHSGSLPRAVRLGYRGPIHCTEATADLLEILLPDSAHIQASDARYLHKRGRHFEPAYDMEDVERTLKQLVTHDLDEEFEVLRGARATFLEAGHIIGAAQVVLDLEHEGDALRLGFTGDLGRRGLPILRDPAPMPPCDVIVTESTYGDRVHPARDAVVKELEETLTEELEKGGRVLIPAFSVGRTQEVLWFLGELIRAGKLPPQDVFIDSPLSNKATRIVDRHRDLYDEEALALLERGIHPFHFPGVRAVESVEESKALNQVRSGVIISASGMCEGGRILHHLEVSLGRPEDLILIVGFQAEGTLGRRLVDGHESVRVFGEEHEVRCRVRYIQGLSAHADREELLAQLLPSRERARQVFVVHGEEDASARFASRLRREGFQGVEVPVYRERFKLGIREEAAAEA
jgi:metallo-beta-lactamase family protein